MRDCVNAPEALPARIRNAAATRAAILDAARVRFAQVGYDCAGVRDIAADAGVDAALISRYFGSKEDLLADVLSCGHSASELFDGERSEFGTRVARLLVLEPRDDNKLDHLLIILRSVSSPRAAEVIRRHGRETFYSPLEGWLCGQACDVRSRLVANTIMGFAIARSIDETFALDEAGREALCLKLAKVLQGTVDTE